MNQENPQHNEQHDQQKTGHEEEPRAKSRDPLVGTVLDGRFQIEDVLGSGGMSVVYKATQLRVNRHVAIKTLRLQLDTKDIYRERFQREISSLCSLNHPNIVTVYDCIIGEDDQPYIVMDYLRGRSLEALIEHEGPLSVERFARISIQICSALEHAHKRGIIHRDLKPGNIVLMDDEMDFVKVVDFGLAKIGDQNKRLTHSGELWGSPPYMSPEQCMGEAQDQRSDLYSIGTVMYEMLCGVDPFPNASTVFEFIKNHTSVTPPPLNSVNIKVNIPAKVEAVVFKALEKDPNHRYQSAKELQDAIVEASAASMDREKSEFLYHLANQASTKSQSNSAVSLANQDGVASGEAPMTASQAFKRALNPLSESMMSGERAFDDQSALASGAGSAESTEAQGQSFTPSVQRWRHQDSEPSAFKLNQSEIVQPTGEIVKPVGEIVSPPAVPGVDALASIPTPPSLLSPAAKAPANRDASPPAKLSRPEVASEAESNPWLLIVLLIAVAFAILVSVMKLLTPHPDPTMTPAITSPASSTGASTGAESGPNSSGESGNKNASEGGDKNQTQAQKDATKTATDGTTHTHKHAHSATRPVVRAHSVTTGPASQTTHAAPPVKTAPAAHGGAKSDPWSALDKMR